MELYDAFADLVEAAAALAHGEPGQTPVLLVFDTFEEVVYRAAEDLLGFWSMLDHLQQRLPQLRVVLAGRGRLEPGGDRPVPGDRTAAGRPRVRTTPCAC